MAIQFVDETDLTGKRVLARFDFNVPLKDGKITDTSRIDLAIPTIKHILENGATKLTLMSHHGRPKGKKDMDYSLEPIANYLAEKLEEEVILTEAAVENGVKELLTLKDTKIVLLENLRFHPEEEENDVNFAKLLSEYGDVYVNDAFGAAHRKHASVYAINSFYAGRAFGGLLLKKEIKALDTILNQPKKPFIAVVGGAKVSDKIKTLEKLLISVDKLIIGGAMAYPFLNAKGYKVGKSLCSKEDIALAKSIIKMDRGNKIELPVDHIISNKFDGSPKECSTVSIEGEMMGLDIGPNTIVKFSNVLKNSKTVLWNGPMGIFEDPNFANGTKALCEIISSLDAFTLVGGGDSVSAVNKSGFAEKFSHISTGGGASLEYIEKGELPGVKALRFGV